jgi:predicted phosphodiesterase
VAAASLRVGVLSDVHGSLVPLELGHAYLRRAGVDHILCGGDIASFGPDPNACVEFLRDHQVATVAGNQDVAMLAPIDIPADASERQRQIFTINAWSQRQLTPASIAWLAALPHELRLDGGFLCVHAAPGDLNAVVGRSDPKPFPDGVRVVCAGHLHEPFVDDAGGRIWANVGSIARPTDGDPRGALGIATLQGGSWSVEIVRLELPLEPICDRILTSGMPFAERVCELQRQSSWW